jgi:hypothetical protein
MCAEAVVARVQKRVRRWLGFMAVVVVVVILSWLWSGGFWVLVSFLYVGLLGVTGRCGCWRGREQGVLG